MTTAYWWRRPIHLYPIVVDFCPRISPKVFISKAASRKLSVLHAARAWCWSYVLMLLSPIASKCSMVSSPSASTACQTSTTKCRCRRLYLWCFSDWGRGGGGVVEWTACQVLMCGSGRTYGCLRVCWRGSEGGVDQAKVAITSWVGPEYTHWVATFTLGPALNLALALCFSLLEKKAELN